MALASLLAAAHTLGTLRAVHLGVPAVTPEGRRSRPRVGSVREDPGSPPPAGVGCAAGEA